MWPCVCVCVCVGRRRSIYVVRLLGQLWNGMGRGGGKCSKRGKIFLARTVSFAISRRTSELLLCRRVVKSNAQWSNDGFVHECDLLSILISETYLCYTLSWDRSTVRLVWRRLSRASSHRSGVDSVVYKHSDAAPCWLGRVF